LARRREELGHGGQNFHLVATSVPGINFTEKSAELVEQQQLRRVTLEAGPQPPAGSDVLATQVMAEVRGDHSPLDALAGRILPAATVDEAHAVNVGPEVRRTRVFPARDGSDGGD